jgi:hypothetical protein
VVQSVLPRAVGIDTLIYVAAIFDRALDNLISQESLERMMKGEADSDRRQF